MTRPFDLTRRSGLALGLASLGACVSPGGNGAIDDPFSTDALKRPLEALDKSPPLLTGGEGDKAILKLKEEWLTRQGFETGRQAFDAPSFAARDAHLQIGAGRIKVLPQSIVRTTGSAGIEAPLRIWRTDADTAGVRDAIVLLVLPAARHSQLMSPVIRPRLEAVLKGGPKAVVLITTGPSGASIWLNAPISAPFGDVPLATLGPRDAAPALAAAETGATGKLVIDGDVGAVTSHTLFGRITGRGPTIVVSTPRTGWTRCVAERGPGLAIWMALARWAPKALPGNDLVFLSTCAHEYDNAGGRTFIRELAPRPEQTRLWVHLGAGFASRSIDDTTGKVATPHRVDRARNLVGTADTLDILSKAFAGQPGLETPILGDNTTGGELGEIFGHGYTRVIGALSANPWHHTDADRLDKTDPLYVRSAGLSFRDVIAVLGPTSAA
jgi:hypothetical protein